MLCMMSVYVRLVLLLANHRINELIKDKVDIDISKIPFIAHNTGSQINSESVPDFFKSIC